MVLRISPISAVEWIADSGYAKECWCADIVDANNLAQVMTNFKTVYIDKITHCWSEVGMKEDVPIVSYGKSIAIYSKLKYAGRKH